MINFLLKSLSPQSANIYRLLEGREPKSAKEIGKSLKIFPNAVYRVMKQLSQAGLVEQVKGYPIKFTARPADQGLDFFTSIMRQNFQETFGAPENISNRHQLLKLVFVQKRDEIIKMTQYDTKRAKYNINLIVSGLELPAETLLVNQRAVERGVKVRLIVQNLTEVSQEKLRSWQKAGVEIKYYPNIEARIFVFDHRIVYFTSYDPKNMHEAIGARFDYAPYAQLMDELFEKRWLLAKEVSRVLR